MKLGKLTVIAATVLSLGLFLGIASAQDVEQGKIIAEKSCRCHKTNLKGKDADFIAKRLKEFRAGEGTSKTMLRKSAGLSDDDIANIAAYYATQQ